MKKNVVFVRTKTFVQVKNNAYFCKSKMMFS